MLWGRLCSKKNSLTLARSYGIVRFLTWSQRTESMAERRTKTERERERERERGRAQQSGPRASVQQWNHGDLSINRQVVVTGSIPAWSIASLLIAMCDVSAAHAPYFHVCQNLYGTSHMYSERLLLHRTRFHFPSAGVTHCRRNR